VTRRYRPPRLTRSEQIMVGRVRQAADAAKWEADNRRRAALAAFQIMFLVPRA
jgi:hypothetical protein